MSPNSPMKSIIITGGAGDIGLALAHHFAASPTNRIALLDIDPAAGLRAVSTIRAKHPHTNANVSFVHCDVASWASQAAAFQAVFEAHGGVVDVVVANAGVTEGGGWEEEEDGEGPREPRVGAVVGVNLVGVVYTVKLAAWYMNKKPTGEGISSRGSILCMSSCAGLHPLPMAPMYSVSKFGVVGLARAMADTLGEKGIQINALAPGVLDSNIRQLPKHIFDKMVITPMATLIRAVKMVLADPKVTGKVVKVHQDRVEVARHHGEEDAEIRNNIEVFWQANREAKGMRRC